MDTCSTALDWSTSGTRVMQFYNRKTDKSGICIEDVIELKRVDEKQLEQLDDYNRKATSLPLAATLCAPAYPLS